jgi:hypothetical protein
VKDSAILSNRQTDQYIELIARHLNTTEMMGGGPDAPSKESSDKKELVLCALPWPEDMVKKAIGALKEEFKDVEVKYFVTGKEESTNIPEGKYSDIWMFTDVEVAQPSYRSYVLSLHIYAYVSKALSQMHCVYILTHPPDLTTRASYLATLFWLPKNGKALPNVKLIQFFSAGTNHVDQHPIYTDSKIPLSSANGVHGPQIAEWVIMMDLVHNHSFPVLYDLQKEKTWRQKAGMNVSDRVGKRVGILGYGSIGRQGELDIFSFCFVGGSLGYQQSLFHRLGAVF